MEWCYACGAIRELRSTGENAVAPSSGWQKPVGEDGNNPFEAMAATRKRYLP
jgi:hypothetical protein